jgi:ABC-2 type transport system ATP-binding protein
VRVKELFLMNLGNVSIWAKVLSIVDLKDTDKKLASQFSIGMKQRLGIAIVLLGDPELLILDEPTNGLDPLGIQELRELIRSFPLRGITVILSSHILTEVVQIVDFHYYIPGWEIPKFRPEHFTDDYGFITRLPC